MDRIGVDLERYEQDGYLALPGMVAAGEFLPLLVWAEGLLAANRPADEVTYRLTVFAPAGAPEVAELVRRFRPMAEALLGAEVVVDQVMVHGICLQEPSTQRSWHQGLAYHRLPYSPMGSAVPLDVVELLIALDDATDPPVQANVFAPGYHLTSMLEHRRMGDQERGDYELIAPWRQLVLSETVAVPMRAGDAVAMSLGTPHACACSPSGSAPSEIRSMRLVFRSSPTRHEGL